MEECGSLNWTQRGQLVLVPVRRERAQGQPTVGIVVVPVRTAEVPEDKRAE